MEWPTLILAVFMGFAGYGIACWTLRREERGHTMSGKLSARCEKTSDTSHIEHENQLLKRDTSRYANIINSSLGPIWMRDQKLNIIYCNLAFSALAEESPDNVALGELELYSGHRQLAEKAWKTGSEQQERRHIVADGNRQLYQIREVPFKKEGLVIGYATDLHELEEAHDEIQRHIAALRDLLGSSTSAMAIYGRDMKLKFYNFAFVALWKFDESWLDTEPSYGEILESMRERRKLPEQANFQAFKQAQLKLFTALIETQEEFFYLPDGKILRVIAIPHALGGILFAYEDVTDRLALERSYNTLIAVQRETLDNLHEGIAVFGESGRLKLCNPVFVKLWKLPPDIGASEPHMRDVIESCRGYFTGEEGERFRDTLLVRLQQRQYFMVRFERTDGSVIDCASVPLPDGATLLTFTDVTDSTLVERSLREKNEALEAADRMKTEFLASVSYELRSPLTSISGFAEMLKGKYVGELNPTQQDYVESIYASAQHLGTMIGNIIDLASIEAGYLKLERVDFSITKALDDALALLGERVRLQNVVLQKHIDTHIDQVNADETRIKQIFFNLASNAVKMSKQKGEINISITDAGEGALRFVVEDSGKGLSHVPDGEESPGRVLQNAVDLGLSIAKRFVELHDGTMTIESETGQGTRITCHFPGLLQSSSDAGMR